MSSESKFFKHAYKLDDSEKTQEFYKEWAKQYDDDVLAQGYASPSRTAQAMASTVSDLEAPLLDLGCGTGLSGQALAKVGFKTIDGTDFSGEMLNAASTKGIYRTLILGDFADPIPGQVGDYSNYTAIGVFSPGHGPPELIEAVVARLQPKGCFGFSLNDHALENPLYEETVHRLANAREIEVVFEEYGDHLPGLGLKSKICVLEKL